MVMSLDVGDPADYTSPYFTWHEAARDYLLGLLSWRAGDTDALNGYAAKFSNEWSAEGPIVESLGHELRGLVAWNEGNPEEALDHFNRIPTDYDWADGFSTVVGRPTWIFFIAEILTDRSLHRPRPQTEFTLFFGSACKNVEYVNRLGQLWHEVRLSEQDVFGLGPSRFDLDHAR